MRTYKIYLIRHAKTSANLEGRYIGSTDVPLCKLGIDELTELTQNYEYPNVGIVYSSPLKRCIQSANIVYPDFKPIKIDKISEYDFGEFENQPIGQLLNDASYQRWLDSEWKDAKGIESMESFTSRIVDGLDEIIMDMMKKKISDAAVFTHGGVIMQLLSICGLPRRKALEWSTANGKGYTLLVNASLWGNTRNAEVFTPVPYAFITDHPPQGFDHEID